jgi:tRNA threonylcarbamoyl adenosine modification protein YeaZ
MATVYLDATRDTLTLGLRTADALHCSELTEGRHDKVLWPSLDRLMTESGHQSTDLTHWVVVNGPGSFTGLRIAVSCVHAMDAVTPCQVLPIDTLSLLAANADFASDEAVIDARMDEVYIGRDKNRTGIFQAVDIIAKHRLEPRATRVCYDHEVAVFAHLASPVSCRLEALVQLADAQPAEAWIAGWQLTPRYIRNTVSWKPLAEQPSRLYDA